MQFQNTSKMKRADMVRASWTAVRSVGGPSNTWQNLQDVHDKTTKAGVALPR